MLLCILIGLFYIVLRHRGDAYENARRKNGRIKDKSVRNVPGPIKEEREIREGKAKNKKGGTGKWERVEKPQTTRSR